jgi:hypothetical protein
LIWYFVPLIETHLQQISKSKESFSINLFICWTSASLIRSLEGLDSISLPKLPSINRLLSCNYCLIAKVLEILRQLLEAQITWKYETVLKLNWMYNNDNK